MRILHISRSDNQGGAAKAAFRLHTALRESGLESSMYVQVRENEDQEIFLRTGPMRRTVTRFRSIVDYLPLRFYPHRDKSRFFSPSLLRSFRLAQTIAKYEADVVHVHQINGGFLSLEAFRDLPVPVVFSLHDTWLYTGGCHVSGSCVRYRDKCGQCPNLGSREEFDLSRTLWERKKSTLGRFGKTCIVGVSRWITKQSESSSLLGHLRHETISNPIDTEVFCPSAESNSAPMADAPPRTRTILFGATSALKDPRKGFALLAAALRTRAWPGTSLVIFGDQPTTSLPDMGTIPVVHKGVIRDQKTLIETYRGADVMVVPSLEEAFGQTASEAMACGVPVVCFGHSGLLDIVDHGENGYLARPFEPEDLAAGINWVLENENVQALRSAARDKVVREFSYPVIAKRASQLYQSMLGEPRSDL